MGLVEGRDTRVLAVTSALGGDGESGMPTGWQSITTLPRVWLVSGLVACALFAAGVSLFSGDSLHRLWGVSAACAYAVAVLAAEQAESGK